MNVLRIFPSSSSSGSLPDPSRQLMGDTIIFRSVQMGSSAVYQCNASNQHGYLLANAFVSVIGEPSRGCHLKTPKSEKESYYMGESRTFENNVTISMS